MKLPIQKYSLSGHVTVKLGTPQDFEIVIEPTKDTPPDFDPNTLLINAPCYSFVIIDPHNDPETLEDGGNYTHSSCVAHKFWPFADRWRVERRIVLKGRYTGLAPAPFTANQDYTIVATINGPATLEEGTSDGR